MVDRAAREVRIERLHLGTVADVEDTSAIAERYGGLTFGAGRRHQDDQEQTGANKEMKRAG